MPCNQSLAGVQTLNIGVPRVVDRHIGKIRDRNIGEIFQCGFLCLRGILADNDIMVWTDLLDGAFTKGPHGIDGIFDIGNARVHRRKLAEDFLTERKPEFLEMESQRGEGIRRCAENLFVRTPVIADKADRDRRGQGQRCFNQVNELKGNK